MSSPALTESLASPCISPCSSQSSVPSSAAMLEYKKKFTIPQKWKPSITSAISKKRLTPDIRNEIVRDLVTHVYGCVGRPSSSFITKIADMLIERYPFMADSSDSTPSVSAYIHMFVPFFI